MRRTPSRPNAPLRSTAPGSQPEPTGPKCSASQFQPSTSDPLAQVVNPAPLIVTVHSASKAYGASVPTFTDSITGFVNGDDSSVVSGSPSVATAATTSSGVG